MTFKEIVNAAVNIINILIPAVIALTVLVFMWGIFRYLFAGGSEDDMRKGRQIMIWGIIVLAIMVSTWGILQIFRTEVLETLDGTTSATISGFRL
jgi:hypothetical protein